MRLIYGLMKLNRMVKSHRLKFAYILFAHNFKFRHLFVKFDPIMACNLSCGMCYFSDDNFRKNNKGIFKEEEIERIAGMLFPRALHVMVGCGAEPTLYKNYPELVKLAKRHGVPYVGMVSNGQLITEDHLNKLIDYGLSEIALSLHGVHKDTYERLMVNSSYERFHDLLATLDRVKAQRGVKNPSLRINYTVNPDNLAELSELFDVFGKYHISTLQVRPIIDFGDTAYRNKDMSAFREAYLQTTSKLAAISKQRGMIFMANTVDPTYQTDVYSSVIVDAVLRYVSPQRVWRTDFDWRNETYTDFCKRIDWNGYLKRLIGSRLEEVPKLNTSTTYEVTF